MIERDGAMTSGWAAGMQSISIISARGGAIAAALCCSLSACSLLWPSREAPVMMPSRSAARACRVDGVSACLRALSRPRRTASSAAASPSGALDALFDRAFRSAQTTTLRMEKAPKEHLQKPDQDRRQLGIKVLDRVLNHRSLPNRRVTVVSVTHACATQKLSSSRAAVAELG